MCIYLSARNKQRYRYNIKREIFETCTPYNDNTLRLKLLWGMWEECTDESTLEALKIELLAKLKLLE